MSAEEKLGRLGEGRQSEATISEACRRHQISHAQFYRWERIARQGALEALCNGARRAKNGKREEWLIAEVNRLHLDQETGSGTELVAFVRFLTWY